MQVTVWVKVTCVPDVLDPNIGACCKEEPMNGDEEKANHVGCESDTDEEYWERLKSNEWVKNLKI
jgi:hypothetical protein